MMNQKSSMNRSSNGHLDMVSNKERGCIEKARLTKLAAAKIRLAELRKDGVTFDNPLDGFTGSIEWK